MTLQLGDIVPDFEQDSTQGRIRFHEWLGSGWGVLFSHPKDFTPVCTTELAEAARLKPEFEKRHAKVIGLSVDPVESPQEVGGGTSKRTQGRRVNFPVIADADKSVSALYGMIHPRSDRRSPCARCSSSIRRRSFASRSPTRRAPGATSMKCCGHRFPAADRCAQGGNPRQLEERR